MMMLLLQQRLDEMSARYVTLTVHTAEREREKIKISEKAAAALVQIITGG